MGLETGTWIDDLDQANPVGASDPKSEGDDHIRLVKKTLQNNFPEAGRAFRFERTVAIATATTLDPTHDKATLLCDVSAGAFTVTLPLGSTVFAGYTVSVMKSDSSGTGVGLAPTVPDTINGSSSALTSKFQYDILELMWDGSEYKIINEFIIGEEVVTFRQPQASDPAPAAEKGHLYTKKTGAGSKAELFWRDEDGNVLQITAVGALDIPSPALDIQDQKYVYAADTSVAADAIEIAPTPAATAYVAGQRWSTLVANTVTGATTVDVNELGTIALKKDQGANDLAAGDIVAGQMIQFEYDGTNFQLVNPVPVVSTVLKIQSYQDGNVATGSGTPPPQTDAIPSNTAGDEYMTAAYTPLSADSNINIRCNLVFSPSGSGGNGAITMWLLKDVETAGRAIVEDAETAGTLFNIIGLEYDLPAADHDLTAITFRIRAATFGTLTFNGSSGVRRYGGTFASTIVITEYAP